MAILSSPKKVDPPKSGFRLHAPQLWEWAVAAVVLLLFIWWKQPQQVPVIVYKAAQFCTAVYIAHLIDVVFFKPEEDEPRDIVLASKEIARAMVYGATVLGLTLGI